MRLPAKLKKALKITGIVVAVFLVLGLADQLWQLRYLPPGAFVRKAEQITQINSASWTTYIGASHNRAYLQFGTPGRLAPIVFWTNLSDLPPDLAAQLKDGKPPWEPAIDRIKRQRGEK